jgi:guanylate kinase
LSRHPSVIVVSAPSGAGKTTVLSRVLTDLPELRFSVSHCTRKPRPGERDGSDYHFVDRPRFEAMAAAGEFLEWATVHGELYGTSRAEHARALQEGADLLLDIDVQGAAQVRRALPGALTIFILPPSRAALEARLRARGADSDATIERRLAAAAAELDRHNEYDYIVVNDSLASCVSAVEAIVCAARQRRAIMEAQVTGILASFQHKSK